MENSKEYLLQFVICVLYIFQVKFGNTTFKTDVYPKSLNPQWNSEWFKFEVNRPKLTRYSRDILYKS